MAERSTSGDSFAGGGPRPERGAHASTPRWVKVFAIVSLILFAVVVVLHLTGRQLGGHMPASGHHPHTSESGT